MFFKIGVLKSFAKFIRKHLYQSPPFNKVAGLRPATLLKMRLWDRCFPVNFAKMFRTSFVLDHLWWLLLPFALSLTGSKYSKNNDMLAIRTHCLKEIAAKCIFLPTKKKQIDNIRRTPVEFALIKSQLFSQKVSLSINVVNYIGKFDLGLSETHRTKKKP